MRFLSLEIENFLSWKKLNLDLTNNNLVYLTGPNGSGKSSIFDSICWVLFGKTTKKDMKADDVVNNKVKKGCRVSLKFKIGKINYEVIRHRKHSKEDNSLILLINGVPASQKRELQKVLESKLGFTYEDFIQTILFSQSDHRYFTQLGETAQRAVLGRLFGFGLFRDAVNRVRDQSRVLVREIMEATGDYNYQKGRILEVKKNISSLKDKKASLVEVDTSEVVKAQEGLAKAKKQIAELSRKIEDVSDHLDEWESNLESYSTLTSRVGAVSKLILLYKSDAKCDACGQLLPDDQAKEFLDKYTKEKSKILQRLKDLEDMELNGKISVAKKELSELVAQKRKVEEEYRGHQVTVRLAESRKEDIDQEIKAKLTSLRKYRATRDKAKAHLEELKQQALYCDFWEAGFGSKGIENFALEKALPLFNATINKYLSKMPAEKGVIAIDYVLRNDHLVPSLRYAGSNNYAGVSGGEQSRIDIAVALALFSLRGVSSNLLMFDEPFDYMEAGAYADVVKMLKDFMAEAKVKSVFVSSHSSDLKAHFQSVWNIKSDSKGNSKIVSQVIGGSEIL